MKMAIVGLGALGSQVAELIKGELILIDRDVVEEKNLERQNYRKEDVGKEKAKAMERVKPYKSIVADLNHKNIDILDEAELILDCTDNLYTRYLINDYCRKTGKGWVYSGVIRNHGFVMGIRQGDACFGCVFPDSRSLDTCDTAGVELEAIKKIAKLQVRVVDSILKGDFEQKLIHFNLDKGETALKTKKRADCKACKGDYEYLDGKKEITSIQHQCSDLYVFFKDIDYDTLRDKLGKKGEYFFYENLTIFRNGRILIKADSLERAKAALDRIIP
ncbi:hypothetical protein GOV09_06375 [Candidatus Woesearchaeota archaeon]|nr:hypothetical protein [Candidatus Woesearchaeota archaeon]